MARLPSEVWPLPRIIEALAAENPSESGERLERRARRIYSFMWRDADRWFSSGGRQVRLKRLFYSTLHRRGGRVGHER